MRKTVLVISALVLLVGGACTGEQTETNPAAFGLDESGDEMNCLELDGQNLHTLEVSVKPVRDSVTSGETAQFRARVLRKADLDQDLKDDLSSDSREDDDGATVELPVEGATVLMAFSLPGLPAWGAAVTDAKGAATIDVKIRRTAPAGTYDGNFYAHREVAQGPCVHVAEEGSGHLEAGLTVKE